MRFVDLCCGIGSFHYSFRKLGWTCVMACDINPSARKTYAANYGIEPMGDIFDIKPECIDPFDVLCAGFPCQPFSNIGLHRGFDDVRGTLFYQIMKFVAVHRPKCVVLENVPGLLSHNQGHTFDDILGSLKTAGYNVVHKVLKCSDYGLPQMRKRLFIVGIRSDLSAKYENFFDYAKYEKKVTLSDFLQRPLIKDTAYTIRCGGRNSPMRGKHNWDGYEIDNHEIYRLSVEDCLKLQGFASSFMLHGSKKDQWALVGNTIPTIFTELIGLSFLNIFV